MASVISEEEIIKRRLLIEGDGGSDDRRLNNLIKTFVKFCNSSPDAESEAIYQKMLCTLVQCQLTNEKAKLLHDMNIREQDNYRNMWQQINTRISEAEMKIIECRDALDLAKNIRKNKQQYDVLAKVIKTHPDRQQTLKELSNLESELQFLNEQKRLLLIKTEKRRSQFHVFITAIHQLQQTLLQDEAEISEEQMNIDN